MPTLPCGSTNQPANSTFARTRFSTRGQSALYPRIERVSDGLHARQQHPTSTLFAEKMKLWLPILRSCNTTQLSRAWLKRHFLVECTMRTCTCGAISHALKQSHTQAAICPILHINTPISFDHRQLAARPGSSAVYRSACVS